MLVRFTSIIATVGLLSASVNAYGMIAQVVDATDFCVFLPPDDATDRIISDSEWDANAFCMGSTPQATGAGPMPSGFIRSAHFVKTDAYVQVTGQIDYTKANLVGTDGGGQMDIKAPTGSSCAGWSYYVNLIEPSTNTYCIRCCNDTTNCNRGISQDGCAKIIPGDYSGPNDGTGAAISGGSSSSTTTATASSTTTTVAASSTTTTATTSSITAAPPTSSSPAAVITPAASPASGSSGNSGSSNSAASGVVSAQSVSGASSTKPMAVAVGAGLLISAAMFV